MALCLGGSAGRLALECCLGVATKAHLQCTVGGLGDSSWAALVADPKVGAQLDTRQVSEDYFSLRPPLTPYHALVPWAPSARACHCLTYSCPCRPVTCMHSSTSPEHFLFTPRAVISCMLGRVFQSQGYSYM